MRHSVYTKFILAYILFGLLSIFFISNWSSKRMMEEITYDEAKVMYDQGNIVLNEYIFNDISTLVSDTDIMRHLETVANINEGTIWITDIYGRIIFDTNYSKTNNIINSFDFTDFGNSFYMKGSFYGNFSENVLSVAIPIASDFRTEGYIILHKSTTSISERYHEQMHVLYMTFVGIFAFSLIILIIFSFVVFMPLTKISAAAREYAKGNFKYEGLSKFTTEDEIGKLGVSLNYMATKLNALDEDEKKFISNISHDFRSPLTSMKGYIEAIKDGTIPYENQEKYLDIILFEADRLTKLTENLLTLSAWDNKSGLLNLTDFNLYELIKPIIATFGGKCEKKHITIDLTLGSKDYIVNADSGKIEQVIYNLIDNAIKFSNANSTIAIDIHDKNDKIFVSIKDSGIGIPKESLPKIFDRFYKTDLSRGKDKTGTGLGLSIVKEMINAHDENINVISTEGVGTEFIFTLKKVKR